MAKGLWTDEQDNALRDMITNGTSVTRVIAKLGRTGKAIRRGHAVLAFQLNLSLRLAASRV